uniref:Uncharacterized protein n=1 Tax=Heterorhabditis bacteriophora TaxID=37862 RepID=A0A1I7WXP4_HETBA
MANCLVLEQSTGTSNAKNSGKVLMKVIQDVHQSVEKQWNRASSLLLEILRIQYTPNVLIQRCKLN